MDLTLSNAKVVDTRLQEPALMPDWSVSDLALRRQVLAELQLVTVDAVGVGCTVLYPVDPDWAADGAADGYPGRRTYAQALGYARDRAR